MAENFPPGKVVLSAIAGAKVAVKLYALHSRTALKAALVLFIGRRERCDTHENNQNL